MSDQIAAISAAVGATLFIISAVALLAQRTQGVPARHRCWAMAALAWQGVRPFVPSRKSVIVATAGFGGLAAGGAASAGLCYALLRWYGSTLPVATEVYEGIGDAMLLTYLAELALAASTVVGLACGGIAAVWTAERLNRPLHLTAATQKNMTLTLTNCRAQRTDSAEWTEREKASRTDIAIIKIVISIPEPPHSCKDSQGNREWLE